MNPSPSGFIAAPTSGTGVENNDYPRIIRLANSADTTKRGNVLVMYSINDTGVRTHSVIKRPMGVFQYKDGAVTPLAYFDIGGAEFTMA